MAKKIKVDVSWTEDNFCCAWADENLGTVLVTAKTLDKLKEEFKEALRLHIDGCVADGDKLPEYLANGDYEIEYVLNTAAILHEADDIRIRMLIDAVNNRTRERNYWRLYCRLLENEITEDEFNREIDGNSDEYVISTDKIPTEQEFRDAVFLSDHIKDIETTGDVESLFSFRSDVCNKYSRRLLKQGSEYESKSDYGESEETI